MSGFSVDPAVLAEQAVEVERLGAATTSLADALAELSAVSTGHSVADQALGDFVAGFERSLRLMGRFIEGLGQATGAAGRRYLAADGFPFEWGGLDP